jgi:hypothetical protein
MTEFRSAGGFLSRMDRLRSASKTQNESQRHRTGEAGDKESALERRVQDDLVPTRFLGG